MSTETKALTLFGSAEISTKEVADIADKLGNAGGYVLNSGNAIAEYNRARNAAVGMIGESHESTAKTLAVQIALLKTDYKPPKGKNKGDKPTFADIAKALTISPTYFSQLGTIGNAIYCSSDETAHTLAEWFTPSTLIKLIPLKDRMLGECMAGIADGSLTPDMTQQDVVKWVDERITHDAEIEPVMVIRNPITGEEVKQQLSVFLDDMGIAPESKVASSKTGVFEELSPTLKLEWTANVYLWDDKRGATVLWVRKHRIPKPAKDTADVIPPANPIEILRQSLERAGYDAAAIEKVLAMQDSE